MAYNSAPCDCRPSGDRERRTSPLSLYGPRELQATRRYIRHVFVIYTTDAKAPRTLGFSAAHNKVLASSPGVI